MRDLELFYRLKEKVLQAYRERYPFFQGDWKNFGARDIQNLIDAIEKETRQTISEKWIYTHLKPETNEKLPRKDMLDILSRFVGHTGWDEFVFQNQERTHISTKKRSLLWMWIVLGVSVIALLVYAFIQNSNQAVQNEEQPETIENTDRLTKENEIVNQESDPNLQQQRDVLPVVEEDKGKTEIKPNPKATPKESFLKPEDYVMILKAFMQSDIKDWETRKQQLDKILSPELEVIVILGNNLGAEYFNKPEFAKKLIVPTASVRKMEIIDLQTDANNKVRFIRIQQK